MGKKWLQLFLIYLILLFVVSSSINTYNHRCLILTDKSIKFVECKNAVAFGTTKKKTSLYHLVQVTGMLELLH